ncbi:dUTPase [Staphylococcus chromogenes]|uniref:dUTPase n=1 Tax=Staphylococcus chromogenes TaxID=46126 RepID=UPI000D1C18E1|nr:dUTPase [Staphylococcus chromogenes]MCE5042840.1 dUTPase [Staphylococcus chromogenes]PTF30889.1 dUTPase [Staphylococcus chromogenes]PUZ16228.1 dUTPase [Staphylococcus chromogenes]QDW90458.1 dUTPase [Staphylococcus chromogenes]QDW92024.1 dUTPase [Staphylococcus chromogenes]
MNNLTIKQLKELLQIQKEFDDRIPTLNLQDSKIAYVVEFFEWFNTLETFKNWKKRPGKPLDVQLDELADMLAFGLSITNQIVDIQEIELERVINCDVAIPNKIDEYDYQQLLGILDCAIRLNRTVSLTFALAHRFYTIDQLIDAYKKKMEVNHARQDGEADTDKGYV